MIYTVLNKQDFEQELQEAGSNLVVIDFFANWCGPCKIVNPHLQEFSSQYAGKAKFLKVNVDDCEDLAHIYNITSMPTFVFLQDHQIVDTLVGSNADELKKYIEKHVNASQVSMVERKDANEDKLDPRDTAYALEHDVAEDTELQEDPSSLLQVIVNEQI